MVNEDNLNELIIKAKNGDINAEKSIIEYSQRFINNIARKLSCKNSTLSKEDLIQDGTIAVIKAIRSYDSSKNVKFSTYVYSTIEYYLISQIKKKYSFIKIPEHVVSQYHKLKKDNCNNKEMNQLSNLLSVFSLDRELCEDESFLNNILYVENSSYLELEDLLKNILEPFEQAVITAFFIENKSIKFISQELNINSHDVSTIKYNAIKKLKKAIKEELF